MTHEFDPDAPGSGSGLFGLDTPPEDARLVVMPVPWEATTSYGRGTERGPEAVLAASQQVDLHDLVFGDIWKDGIALLPQDPRIARWAHEVVADAAAVIESHGTLPDRAKRVDRVMDALHALVEETARKAHAEDRIFAVLGGDHSAPYGAIKAASERWPGLGVLHVDAHADMREAYLGFRWSHASIFHNVLELPGIAKLVGVGYRDVGTREWARIEAEPDRITAFADHALARDLARGRPWIETCEAIVAALPAQVYVSFDIDGLDPTLCPNTGTPVPGGLSFRDASMLLEVLSASRQVVGFDLCEVAPGQTEWDANVGARMLYRLAGCALRSVRS
jgi:agmatinase